MKNDELEAKHQKYEGRVVLRGDIVKDDSGSYAVFTEQGSSASQMTAAKVMDIICLFVHREKGLFLSVYVDDINLAGKKQNIDPMWKVLNKEVDLLEPTSFLDHVYLSCTQKPWEISKDIVDDFGTMFESRISARATEKLPSSANLSISSWSHDMEGHAKKCVERYCELANKTIQQLYKVSTPCIGDHHLKEEEMKSCWRIVNGVLSNCSEMLILGTNWKT